MSNKKIRLICNSCGRKFRAKDKKKKLCPICQPKKL